MLKCAKFIFSRLNEYKFRTMCNCGANIVITILHLLRCQRYSVQRLELLDGVYKLDSALQNPAENQPLSILLCGSEKFALNVNKEILNPTIKASERFVESFF